MTRARAFAFGALVVALIVVAVVLLRGGGGHRYVLLFQNAGQLVKDDDVQVAGRRIGSVRDISLTSNNLARIEIEVQGDYAPLHRGTTALIRQTSLSGIANRYIALSLGPNSAPPIADGATIQTDQTTSPVDLDQLINSLDPQTRRGLQELVEGFATQLRGEEPQANAAAHYFNPAISTARRLVGEITSDQAALNAFLRNAAGVTHTLAARAPVLTDLVTNSNTTATAIGDENVALARALDLLPPTLRRANTTFVNLRAALNDLDRLTAVSKPATRRLAPFLRALRPLVTAARPTIHDLLTLIHRPGRGNDLIDLLHQAPVLEREARPTFAHTITSLRKSTPVLSFIRPYVPELTQWFRDFGDGASNYDANGHFARIQPIFNAFSLGDNPLISGGTLQALPAGSNPLAGLSTGNLRRCPGTATQIASDHSNDWRGANGQLDCDPSEVPPGP